jgi:hypothetical protein
VERAETKGEAVIGECTPGCEHKPVAIGPWKADTVVPLRCAHCGKSLTAHWLVEGHLLLTVAALRLAEAALTPSSGPEADDALDAIDKVLRRS